MKNCLRNVVLVMTFAFSFLKTDAQKNKASSLPKWVSDRGFWVVEKQTKQPRTCTIFFYNNDKLLVYKENITSKKFRPARRKTLKRIKQVLETAVLAWEQKQPLKENGKFFIAAE
jgi:hypothetical protein